MPAMTALLRPVAFSLALAIGVASAQEGLSIAAVVNDDVITMLDLSARTRFVALATNLPDLPEARDRLAGQVLRTLIDERLKLQEAERLGISVTQNDIDGRMANIAEQGGPSPERVFADLEAYGIPPNTLTEQFRAEVAWERVVLRVLAPRIVISEDMIDETLAQLRAEAGQPRYLVSEIFLPVDSASGEAEVRQSGERLVAQLRAGADFAAVARQFSQASSAAAGGNLGWVSPSQLDRALAAAVAGLAPTNVSDPIRSIGGFHILQVRDRRTAGGAGGPGSATLARVFFVLPDDASTEETQTRLAEARSATVNLGGCKAMAALGREVNPEATQTMLRNVPIAEMAPELSKVVIDSRIGEASQALRIPGGVVVVMVCERTAEGGGLPGRAEVRQRLSRDRLEVSARGYLRDLRRAAVVDVRL